MQPQPWPEPVPEIAAAIRRKYAKRKAPLAVTVRDRLGEWLHDEDFAVAFGVRGRPGWSPARLALITVLQMAENLDDRGAAEAVTDLLSWQYAHVRDDIGGAGHAGGALVADERVAAS
jgi:hypothetical protein